MTKAFEDDGMLTQYGLYVVSLIRAGINTKTALMEHGVSNETLEELVEKDFILSGEFLGETHYSMEYED